MFTQNKKTKRSKKPLILCVIVLLVITFSIWCSQLFYTADETATLALSSSESVTFIDTKDYYGFISKDIATSSGFILYPGALVNADAYAPLMSMLAEKGISSFIAKMPFDLALFKKNAAQTIILAHPEIEDWYIGGHSLGGVLAATYADENPDQIKGIAFLASYPNTDLSDQSLKVLSIYGSEDQVLNLEAYKKASPLLPTDQFNEIILEGGNHANFGHYGAQKGDGTATLSADKQQQLTTEALYQMITTE